MWRVRKTLQGDSRVLWERDEMPTACSTRPNGTRAITKRLVTILSSRPDLPIAALKNVIYTCKLTFLALL